MRPPDLGGRAISPGAQGAVGTTLDGPGSNQMGVYLAEDCMATGGIAWRGARDVHRPAARPEGQSATCVGLARRSALDVLFAYLRRQPFGTRAG